MGFIGLSPTNFISPIDFIPGIGPLNRLFKAGKWANKARKSKKGASLLGKARGRAESGMAWTQGILGTVGMYADYVVVDYLVGGAIQHGSNLYAKGQVIEAQKQRMGRGTGSFIIPYR